MRVHNKQLELLLFIVFKEAILREALHYLYIRIILIYATNKLFLIN